MELTPTKQQTSHFLNLLQFFHVTTFTTFHCSPSVQSMVVLSITQFAHLKTGIHSILLSSNKLVLKFHIRYNILYLHSQQSFDNILVIFTLIVMVWQYYIFDSNLMYNSVLYGTITA